MQITQVTVIPQTVKLHKVFKISFDSISELQTLIVKVETDAGVTGYGECSPYEPVTGENLATETAALQTYAAALRGVDPQRIEHVHEVLDQTMLGHTAAKAGIDMACYDILGKAAGVPVYKLLGGSSNHLTSDMTIGIDDVDVMAADAKAWVAKGFKELKIKCGIDDAHDIATIRAIRAAVGPDIDIRIDANQGWTAKQAARMMVALGNDVSAVEQPLPADQLAAMPALRPQIAQEVMLDESVHTLVTPCAPLAPAVPTSSTSSCKRRPVSTVPSRLTRSLKLRVCQRCLVAWLKRAWGLPLLRILWRRTIMCTTQIWTLSSTSKSSPQSAAASPMKVASTPFSTNRAWELIAHCNY